MMQLTTDIILYYIRDYKPLLIRKPKNMGEIRGIKIFCPEESSLSSGYLYVGELEEVFEITGLRGRIEFLFRGNDTQMVSVSGWGDVLFQILDRVWLYPWRSQTDAIPEILNF